MLAVNYPKNEGTGSNETTHVPCSTTRDRPARYCVGVFYLSAFAREALHSLQVAVGFYNKNGFLRGCCRISKLLSTW